MALSPEVRELIRAAMRSVDSAALRARVWTGTAVGDWTAEAIWLTADMAAVCMALRAESPAF